MKLNNYEIRKYTISTEIDGNVYKEIFYAKFPHNEKKHGNEPWKCHFEIIDNFYDLDEEDFKPSYFHREIDKKICDDRIDIEKI